MNEHGLLEKPEVFKAEAQECDHREFSFDYPLQDMVLRCLLIDILL